LHSLYCSNQKTDKKIENDIKIITSIILFLDKTYGIVQLVEAIGMTKEEWMKLKDSEKRDK
jgi:hypothetical protein